MVHFIELLAREIMIHMNPVRQPEFDVLLMPFSWVRVLAYKYRNLYNTCSVDCLSKLFSAIQRFSLELRFGVPGKAFPPMHLASFSNESLE
jgi:hypothetical protein